MFHSPLLFLGITEFGPFEAASLESDFDAAPNISTSGASLLLNMSTSSSNRPPLFETDFIRSLDTVTWKSVLFCDLEPELATEKNSSPESESSKSDEIFDLVVRFESDLLGNGGGSNKSFSNTSSCNNADEVPCCSCLDCCCCCC